MPLRGVYFVNRNPVFAGYLSMRPPNAQANHRNITNRKSFRRPREIRCVERPSERKLGNWHRVPIPENSPESSPVNTAQVSSERRNHGETSSVSNCRPQSQIRRGKRIRARKYPMAQKRLAGHGPGYIPTHVHRQYDQ